MSLMPKLMEINDELVRVCEERDQAVGNVVRLQAQLAEVKSQLEAVVQERYNLQTELAATHEALQRVCSTLPPKSAKSAGQNDLVRDVSHYIEAAEVDRPTEPQPEQDGVLVQEGWWLQADGSRVYVRPANPTASNKGKIAQGYVWSDGARLYHSDGGHGDTPTPHDLVKFLGKEPQTTDPHQHPAEYTPPEGWRVLQVGEVLRGGDVWVNHEGESWPTKRVGERVNDERYIRQIEPEPEFKPYTFAAYIVGDKSQPDALRIVWATEEWIQHSQFGIVHRMRDMHLFDNDGGCNITEYHETLTLSLEVQ